MGVMRKDLGAFVAVCAALLVAGGLGAPAAGAKAKPKTKKYKATVEVIHKRAGGIEPGTTKKVEAECPRGFTVLSGGYIIGGDSAFAHASRSNLYPDVDSRSYVVTITNPQLNPFAGIPAESASVSLVAFCTAVANPVVIDGPVSNDVNYDNQSEDTNVSERAARVGDVSNNTVADATAKCRKGTSVYNGGYNIGGSPFAYPAGASILSKINGYQSVFTSLPFDPTLGVLLKKTSMTTQALCAPKGKPVIPLGLDATTDAVHSAHAAKKKKPLKGTVSVKIADKGGIASGDVETVEAKCPGGTSVYAGSYELGDSALAHVTAAVMISRQNQYEVTVVNPPADINAGIPKSVAKVRVAANCVKNGKPMVVNGPFSGG